MKQFRRILSIVLLAPLAVALAAAPAAAVPVVDGVVKRVVLPVPGVGCPDADLVPGRANLGRIRRAVLCLHNAERRERGLPVVREQLQLQRAARRHSADMVRRRYFAHVARNGTDHVGRVRRTGYLARARSWSLGENLAWGTGSLSTPRAIMRSWMSSPGHRANVLRRSYRELGIGVRIGTPAGAGDGVTYTANFGRRG